MSDRRTYATGSALLIVRHGQSTWNAEHRWAGQADPPLSDAGRDGAARLGEQLAGQGFTHVVASDLRRAAETATIVAERLAVGAVRFEARLRERRCDAWSGLTSAEIEVRYPGALARWRRGDLRELPGDSERWDAFAGRVTNALVALARHPGRGLVVAHAGTFRVVESVCGVEPTLVDNLCGHWLTLAADGRLQRAEPAWGVGTGPWQTSQMREYVVGPDDPRSADVRALLESHLAFAREHSPPEDVHALDATGLVAEDVSFFSVRDDGELLGVGALRQLDESHAELKSMHTAGAARGRGIGRSMLNHLLEVARSRGCRRVSLETGSMAAFAPARALYAAAGFEECEPFASYRHSRNSVCMTLSLEAARADAPRLRSPLQH